MKVLFDVNTPHPLKRHLPEHEITFAQDLGWSELRNGDLIRVRVDTRTLEGSVDVLNIPDAEFAARPINPAAAGRG